MRCALLRRTATGSHNPARHLLSCPRAGRRREGKVGVVRDHFPRSNSFQVADFFIGDLSPFRLGANPAVLLAGAAACAAR